MTSTLKHRLRRADRSGSIGCWNCAASTRVQIIPSRGAPNDFAPLQNELCILHRARCSTIKLIMDPGTAQTYHPPPSYASAPLLPQSDEKSAASVPPARIVGYPGYPGYDVVDAYGGPLPAPGIHEPRNRRSRTRRFVARAVHMLMLLTIFIMLFPAFLRGIARVSRAVSSVLIFELSRLLNTLS